jgi:peptide/nickel transport system ATP-binding protein
VKPTPLVEVVDLEKRFPLTRTATEFFEGRPVRSIHAVDRLSLTIGAGETLGLIGESGSGKTTLGWLVSRLHEPTSGVLRFSGRLVWSSEGATPGSSALGSVWRATRTAIGGLRRSRAPPSTPRPSRSLARAVRTMAGSVVALVREPLEGLRNLEGDRLREWRRNVQVVFQDPVGSLDPRLKVWQIVGEPIRAQDHVDRPGALRERRRVRRENARRPKGAPALPVPPVPPRLTRAELRARVRALLPTVGLPEDCLDQYPHEFSGGGRQRLSLARALSVRPKLVILDEPTSALDVAVQAQILNRLVDLQREQGLTYLLITHNVAAVRYVADRVAVMYLGQIVEVGSVRGVLEHPVHPYTKALLAAVPVADARRRRSRFRIGGDVPSLIDPLPGCRFAPRCPFAVPRCRVEDPLLREIPGAAGQRVACHRAEEVRDIAPGSLLETAGGARLPPPGTAS